MAIVISGKNWEGKPCHYHLNDTLKKNIDEVKKVVSLKDWDYVSIVAGNPGVGKSNFAISLARYCCEWFDETYIAFTAEQFINLTNSCPKNSSVMLDESFASLNSRIGMSSDFLRIVNHLQLIRQKNLYVFLVLPNFFDLAKGIAIYRSHHLFVCYGKEFGDRGSFAAFSRETKKQLYVLGSKFMNYNCVKPNFRGRFVKQKAIKEETYNYLKRQHLEEQGTKEVVKTRFHKQRDDLIFFLFTEKKARVEKISEILSITVQQVYSIIRDMKAKKKEGII